MKYTTIARPSKVKKGHLIKTLTFVLMDIFCPFCIIVFSIFIMFVVSCFVLEREDEANIQTLLTLMYYRHLMLANFLFSASHYNTIKGNFDVV